MTGGNNGGPCSGQGGQFPTNPRTLLSTNSRTSLGCREVGGDVDNNWYSSRNEELILLFRMSLDEMFDTVGTCEFLALVEEAEVAEVADTGARRQVWYW